MEEQRTPHKYLKRDDYYETGKVNRGRSNKYCEHCGELIPMVCLIECTDAFINSLKLTDETR